MLRFEDFKVWDLGFLKVWCLGFLEFGVLGLKV